MKKGASKRLKRQAMPNIVVPPSPYGFEETVKRMLKVKPPTTGRKKAKPKS